MFVLFLIFIFLIDFSANYENVLISEAEELYKNLVENLRVDPFLLESNSNEEAKRFIDKKIDSFVNLFGESESSIRTKRSSVRNESDGNVVELQLYRKNARMYPIDLRLFKQDSEWFAAYLEGTNESESEQRILIKHYQNDSSIPEAQHEVRNGVNIAVLPMESSTFIAISENVTHGMNIYEFHRNNGLKVIQTINSSHAIDVALWKDKQQNVFMSVVQSVGQSENETSEVQIAFYKWNGKRFVIFQSLKTYGTKKITPFFIGDVSYLAVANSEDENGNEKTYSEILKFNLHKKEYEIVQRILTYGCSDIEYFRTNFNNESEHFVITSSYYYDKESEVKHRNHSIAPSIIYKFVDDFFIPFQSIRIYGVRKWLPIQMETRGNVILLAFTPEGLHCLQNDGWRYENCETHLKNVSSDIIRDVSVLHYGELQDRKLLVIITKNSDEVLVEINFSPEYKVRKLHDELLSWCMDSVKLVDSLSDNILGDERRGDNMEELDSASQQVITEEDKLVHELRQYEKQIVELNDTIHNNLETDNPFDTDSKLVANTIILNGPAVMKSVDVKLIQNTSVEDILNNVLDLNEGFEISEDLNFKTIYVPEGIEITEKINNVDKNSVLHTDDSIEFDDVSVQGDVRCEDQLKVSETINNIRFDDSELLLRTGDQNFSEFSIDHLFAQNLVSNSFENIVENRSQSSTVTSVEMLKVKDLKIGGYLNGVKIATLNKYALRNSGDQDISVPCYFNHLEVDNLETKRISGKNIQDELVKISEGEFHLNKDVIFTEDLSANNITATNLINSIPVLRNGRLDVLLTDIPEQQSIEGRKIFDDLRLFDSIDLHGKIQGKALDKLKPFVTIESNLEFEGDKRITGDVIAEEIIRADNIVSSERLNSLRRVRSEALRLTDVEIPNRMSFFQHLNVDDVFARRINNIDARLLVVNGAKQTQVVEGWKKFKGDLEITGNTEVLKINSFDMKEMERNVMKRSGDQFVKGKHYVKLVAADGGVKSNITKFGNLPWKDVIRTNEDQSINGTITFSKNLTAKSISAQIVDLKGLINGENFTEILNDAVTQDSTRRIYGTKTFKNITIHFLESTKKLEESEMDIRTVRLSDIDVMDTVSVKNIICNEKLNDIAKDDFRDFLDEEFELVFDGDETLGNITVFGNVHIDSNRIGDLSLEDLENNTLKRDEPFEFDTVEFSNIVVNNGIDLQGHVENLDLDNVPRNNQTNEATNISHEKIFHQNVSIDGRILINDTMNNVAVSELCGFVSSSSDEKHLILKGNAAFAKGPKVIRVNNFDLQELVNRSWFNDRPVNISSSVKIENAELLDDLFVQEYVNDKNLTQLADKYFSKSKEQQITGFHIVSDTVVFRDDVASPELIIDGDINGMNMEKFMKSVLLHRPQLFEDTVYFENIFVEYVDGSYNINGLDLENDVMRYDKPNKVVGTKLFHDLNANILRLDKNVEVQEVDILALTTGAILKNGRFRIVGEPVIASAVFQEGLSLRGNLNSVSFDEETLLLKRSPQNITGRLSFGAQAETKFKALKVRGLVNNADIEELLHNQVSRNGDTTIKSSIHFEKNIKAKNINFEGLCQGINVTELLLNITKLSSLNNQKDNYQQLLKISRNIENSFKGQAFYLVDFKLTFAEKGATVLKIQGKDEKMGLLSCSDNFMFIQLFSWNEEYHRFEKGYSKMLGAFPGFSTKVRIRGIDYIYYETEKEHDITVQEEYSPPLHTGVIEEPYINVENNPGHNAQSLDTFDTFDDNTHTGFLLSIDNDTTYSRMPFLTKGTIFMTSFEISLLRVDCLLFIDYQYETNIICMGDNDEFYIHQSIREEKAYTASFIMVGDSPYLITLVEGTDNEDTRMIIRKFNRETQLFEIDQTIYMKDPRFLSTISSPHGYFISVTYDYKMTTLDFGNIVLWRFDTKFGEFLKWQNIKVDAPIRAEFALLPSDELSLYVLTQNPVSPLIVYLYEGIAGFKEKMISSLIPNVQYMNQFSIRNDHFLVLQNSDEINILRGIFKGHKSN